MQTRTSFAFADQASKRVLPVSTLRVHQKGALGITRFSFAVTYAALIHFCMAVSVCVYVFVQAA